MERAQVFQEVTEICKDVFGNSAITLTDDSTAQDVEEWDSLTHLTLIYEIEAKYDVQFTLDEAMKSPNLGELVNALMKRLAEKSI